VRRYFVDEKASNITPIANATGADSVA
jgi:hypothetical protein